ACPRPLAADDVSSIHLAALVRKVKCSGQTGVRIGAPNIFLHALRCTPRQPGAAINEGCGPSRGTTALCQLSRYFKLGSKISFETPEALGYHDLEQTCSLDGCNVFFGYTPAGLRLGRILFQDRN